MYFMLFVLPLLIIAASLALYFLARETREDRP